MKAKEFLDQLNPQSVVFEENICYEYTEKQLVLFAELYHKHKATNNDVSGTVWVVQDTMSGMIAGMFDSQIKAIKYTDKSKGMAIINMEVI